MILKVKHLTHPSPSSLRENLAGSLLYEIELTTGQQTPTLLEQMFLRRQKNPPATMLKVPFVLFVMS